MYSYPGGRVLRHRPGLAPCRIRRTYRPQRRELVGGQTPVPVDSPSRSAPASNDPAARVRPAAAAACHRSTAVSTRPAPGFRGNRSSCVAGARQVRLPAAAQRPQGRLVPVRLQPLRRSGIGAITFNSFEADIRQFASILAERRVFAARALVTTTNAGPGGQVPFYLLPTLGGNDTLRGFRVVAVPRAAPDAPPGGVSLGDLVGVRGGAVRRRRQGRDEPRGLELQDPRARLRVRLPLQHRQRRGHPHRRGIRLRDGKHLHIVAGGIF